MLRRTLGRRRLLLPALLLLAAFALSAPAASATTFQNTDGITINDGDCPAFGGVQAPATPYPSPIVVSGLVGQVVTDVNVTLTGFTHTFPRDVRVLLVGPQGQTTLLLHENGGNIDAVNLTLTFDDAAAQSPPTDGSALTSTTYRPSDQSNVINCALPTDSFPAPAPAGAYGSTLSGFNGTDPNGTWSLYVVDDNPGDVGSITAWSLDITAAANTAPVAVDDAYTHYGSDTALSVAAPGVLANDTDADNDPLTAALVSGPSNGSLTLNADGSFSYQPNEDFVGQDSFTYRANDGTVDSNLATVTITVGAGCRGQQATITGTGASQTLEGTAGDDVIAGLGGDDKLSGNGGNDTLCGGSGRDSINADAGNDYADGGSGNDILRGDIGNDTLLGGAGADTLLGGAGNDSLAGGAGAPDTCRGDTGTDTLAANHGCERISGVP